MVWVLVEEGFVRDPWGPPMSCLVMPLAWGTPMGCLVMPLAWVDHALHTPHQASTRAA